MARVHIKTPLRCFKEKEKTVCSLISAEIGTTQHKSSTGLTLSLNYKIKKIKLEELVGTFRCFCISQGVRECAYLIWQSFYSESLPRCNPSVCPGLEAAHGAH